MSAVDAPVAGTPEKSRGKILWAGRAMWAAVGAVVGLLATVTPVLDWAAPDLRSDPQVQLEGSVRIVAVERGVTYGGYLLREQAREQYRKATPAERNASGVMLYVSVATKGLKRMWGTLRWYGYDATTRHRISAYDDVSRGFRRIRGGTTSDRLIVPLWAQVPPDGRYFLRFELRARGVLLSMVDTKPFENCLRIGCSTG